MKTKLHILVRPQVTLPFDSSSCEGLFEGDKPQGTYANFCNSVLMSVFAFSFTKLKMHGKGGRKTAKHSGT